MTPASPALLFSFGTLLDAPVQAAVFGGPVPSQAAELAGHDVVNVPITDPHVLEISGLAVHRGLRRREGASVAGGVLALTPEQLARADEYEVDAYVRRRVRLADGTAAWAYVAADPLAAAERIGVVGDSIASGRTDPDGGWAGRLARHHLTADEARHRVFALALPGATLTEVAEHAPAELAWRRADTALISAGVNDLAGAGGVRRSPAELVVIMEGLCRELEERGTRPVVLAPIWTDEERTAREFGLLVERGVVAAYRDALLTWGTETHRDVVDLWPALEGRPELIDDGVHHRGGARSATGGEVGPLTPQ